MKNKYGGEKIQKIEHFKDLMNPAFSVKNISDIKFFIIKTEGRDFNKDYNFITAVLERYFSSRVDVISFFFTIHFVQFEIDGLLKLISKFHHNHLQLLIFNVDEDSVYNLFESDDLSDNKMIRDDVLNLGSLGEIEFDGRRNQLIFDLKEFVTIGRQVEDLFILLIIIIVFGILGFIPFLNLK